MAASNRDSNQQARLLSVSSVGRFNFTRRLPHRAEGLTTESLLEAWFGNNLATTLAM
jgi:hypothetical protein